MPPRKPTSPPQTPLYVRLPAAAGTKLDRAAAALGMHKKDLVANLVTKYVDPDSQRGLSALGALQQQSTVVPKDTGGGPGPLMGTYSFQAYDPPEVMNSHQVGELLQIDEKNVIELAEAGKLPGKKLGPVWRFSRAALVAWLATPEGK